MICHIYVAVMFVIFITATVGSIPFIVAMRRLGKWKTDDVVDDYFHIALGGAMFAFFWPFVLAFLVLVGLGRVTAWAIRPMLTSTVPKATVVSRRTLRVSTDERLATTSARAANLELRDP